MLECSLWTIDGLHFHDRFNPRFSGFYGSVADDLLRTSAHGGSERPTALTRAEGPRARLVLDMALGICLQPSENLWPSLMVEP